MKIKKKEDELYDIKVLMLQLSSGAMLIKKRRWMNLEYSHNYHFPPGHEGIEPLIIMALVGRTLIHRIYVDNGCLVNILYEHCLERLLEEVKIYIQPTTLSVVGFKGQSVWPEGKLSLPFTLFNYECTMSKTVLPDFIIIKSPSPYIMLLGRTTLWQLQAGALYGA